MNSDTIPQRKTGADRPSQIVPSAALARWKTLRKNLDLLILTLPAMLLIFLFAYAPLPGLALAFKKYNFSLGIFGSKWVGLQNFEFFFASNDAFIVTRNTILYNLTFIILTNVCAVFLALLLKGIGSRWIKLHQTVLFLPHFLSFVVIGYVALALFDFGDGIVHANGYVNKILNTFGIDSIMFYFDARYWPFILTLFALWKFVGFSTLIYFAGIISIDPAYYEAASIDGATKWQATRHITVPLLTSLIAIMVILSLGGIFRSDFGLFYFIPNNVSFLYSATDVIDTYIYRSLKMLNDNGLSTAIGLYQSVVGFLTVIGANYAVRKINEDNSLW